MKTWDCFAGSYAYGQILAPTAHEALRLARMQESAVDKVVLVARGDEMRVSLEDKTVTEAPMSSADTIADYLTKAGLRIVWVARYIDENIRKPNKTFDEFDKTRIDSAIDDLEFAKSQLVSLRKHIINMEFGKLGER